MYQKRNTMSCKSLIIIILLSISSTFSFSQKWEVIHNFSPQQTLQKVRFRNSQYGLTVGSLYNGSTKNIHRTIDGGKTWKDVSSGYTSMRFMDIFFVSDSVVYMSGNEGIIIRSYDGGLNWETMTTDTKEQLWGIHFISAKIGIAVGSNGKIIYSNNGGRNWEDVSPGKSNLLYDVTFNAEGVGFASGSNILWRSDDGGLSWNEVIDFPYESPADWIRSITFINEKLGFACADIGRIYRTTDGGDTWSRMNSPTQEPLFEVDFIDDKNGMIVGFTGTILHTKDGGENWTILSSPLGKEHNYSLDYIDADHAFACTHFGSIIILKNSVNTNQLNNDLTFEITPNPANDYIRIQTNITDLIQIKIISSQGQSIIQKQIYKNEIIPIDNLPSGLYLLQIHSENDISSKYFFKQ